MTEKVYRFRANGLVADGPPHAAPPDKWTEVFNANFPQGQGLFVNTSFPEGTAQRIPGFVPAGFPVPLPPSASP